MGDAHGAIDVAMREVFPDATRLMCAFHAINAMQTQFPAKLENPDSESRRVLKEIQDLQLAPSEAIFQQGSRALLEFWRSPQRNLTVFADYFEKSWVRHLPNW